MYSSVNTILGSYLVTALVFFIAGRFFLCVKREFTKSEKQPEIILMKNLDGFLHWNTGILAGRIRTDVWKRFRNHWQL